MIRYVQIAEKTIIGNIDETIYYLGQAYTLICQNIKKNILFNGNQETNNNDFDNYLKRFGYKFKNENNEVGGYAIIKNKKYALIMDVGSCPEKKFSKDYQAGALSFEIISGDKKLICNSGYFQNYKHRLNDLSKSTASQSTLIIDNQSSCKLRKQGNKHSIVENGWEYLTGVLNNEHQRIHDNDYYQNFSYSIKSRVSYEDWKDVVGALNHTAGFRKWSNLQMESTSDDADALHPIPVGQTTVVVDISGLRSLGCEELVEPI